MQDITGIAGDDYQVEGQLNLFDFLDQKEGLTTPLIAVSKIFAAAIKQMNLKEWKTFIYALTHIKWTEQNREIVHMDKWELIKILGTKGDSSDITAHLKRDIGHLPAHSFIQFEDKDRGYWENGNFIERIGVYKNVVRVAFARYYLPLFQELDRERQYITLWADDLFGMSSERSILFYESLRLHSDTTKENTRTYGIKDFKVMFGIPKDGGGSYMRKDGHFDRPAFEKKVIDPICDDLKKCRMINLTINGDGKPYRKIRYHGRVIGYEFCWTISTHPAVATAAEVKEIQERADKDPMILKTAKDLLTGEKRQKKKKAQEPKSGTDYNALAEELMAMQDKH